MNQQDSDAPRPHVPVTRPKATPTTDSEANPPLQDRKPPAADESAADERAFDGRAADERAADERAFDGRAFDGRGESGKGGSGTLPDSQQAPTDSNSTIRVGSPFAVDPVAPQANKRIEHVYDVGPMRYTAMGAVVASCLVLGFAAVATWWFPTGGALIAALGCLLSIFGMYSAFRKTAGGLLAMHLGLFILSYGRSLG